MWFNPIFERFVEKSPVTVILRALMEVVLTSSKLDGELREKVGFLKARSAEGSTAWSAYTKCVED